VSDETLRRELAERTAEVESLRAEVAALKGQVTALTARPGEPDQQVMEWRAKAAEYDALMKTKTMHAVRIPRAIYGRILARRSR